VAFKSQSKNEEGEIIPSHWEKAMNCMDEAIAQICAECYATEPPILFLTGKNNFRDEIAKEKVYKGTRKKDKPFHYANLKAYVLAAYACRLVDGLEADDLLAIEQTRRIKDRDTIICSRDKDLRIQEGYHYSWEVANQPRFGPAWVDELGVLQLKRGGKKLFGTGQRFFYSQLLTGDSTDNIPGLGRYGPVKTFNALKECNTTEELFKAVRELYIDKYGDHWREPMLERGRCLWMTKYLNEDMSPVLWEIPEVE
jgi:5'-3' exonuclease